MSLIIVSAKVVKSNVENTLGVEGRKIGYAIFV